MSFDPVLLEILNNQIAAVCDEMCFTVQRSSRSNFVKEAADFGVGLCGPAGKTFGVPPSHSIQFLMDADWGPTLALMGDLEPRDVVITNDPYASQGMVTHLPDLHMAEPYFIHGRIVCFGWSIIHFTDVGGRVASSIAPSNTDLFQEGLRIPPMKIVKKGAINRDLVSVFTANCRTPDVNMGDVHAMLGSLAVGRRRIADLVTRHGLEVFLEAQEALADYAAAKARAVLQRLPNGTYVFWDYMDDDYYTPIPIRFRVAMTIENGEATLDFTGTDPQMRAAYNVPTGERSWWFTVRLTSFLLTHDPSIPLNHGAFRPVTYVNPRGTCVNAEFPDPVGIRSAPARRLNDAVTGVLLAADADMMSAPSCGAGATLVLVENDARLAGGRNVLVVEPVRGGMGASRGHDGVDARDATMSNMQNHPIENIEAEGKLIIREYDVYPDSGGPGRWRGGCGQLITLEILQDGGVIMIRGMERLRFPSWGVAGGRPGRPFRAVLNLGTDGAKDLTKIDELRVDRGDTITFMMPGAGGYGDPFLRDPVAVLDDVTRGVVTAAGAAGDFGVVIDGEMVDEAATRTLRDRRDETPSGLFDFGSERLLWERVFDDPTMLALNRGLMEVPKAVRYETRRRLFHAAVGDIPFAATATLESVLTDPQDARARLRDAMARELGTAIDDRAAP